MERLVRYLGKNITYPRGVYQPLTWDHGDCIHRSAWKANSANFAFTAFSEVRYPQATPSNGKDSSSGVYADGLPPPYLGCYSKQGRGSLVSSSHYREREWKMRRSVLLLGTL